MENKTFGLNQIGVIRTPYQEKAPYQPVEDDSQEFYVQLDQKYAAGLRDLEKFTYAYLLFWADRVAGEPDLVISPSWLQGKEVGLFSSRSPARPNPIGLSVVRIKGIFGNEMYTSGLDVFDRTPLLDIKPYIKDLDTKYDANYGWLEEMDDMEHLSLHIRGIPHDY